jgi:iron complex outermembrane receptor protein
MGLERPLRGTRGCEQMGRIKMSRATLFVGGSALALALCAFSASAQAATTQPSASDTNTVGEIVVTAQKRNESAQVVPVSITAISSTTLQSQSIRTVDNLSTVTPGLSFGRVGPGNGTPFLRGIGSNVASPGAEAAVSTYIDGVYIGSQYAPMFSFNNISNIEIDKGPQGTLFGRNATGGVIQVNTKDPSHTPHLDAEVGYGNYNTTDAKLYASAGITDTLAADIALYEHDQNDGWGKNLYNGKPVYTSEDLAARTKWVWAPTDKTKITLSLDYSYDYGQIGTAGNIPEGEYFRPPGPTGNPGPFLSSYPGFYNTDENSPSYSRSNQGGASLKIWHDFGGVQVVSITSYRKSEIHGPVDSDLTPDNWKSLDTNPGSETETQEFQLLSPNNPDSRLKWIVGAFFYHDRSTDNPISLIGYGYNAHAPISIFAYQSTTSYAAFGQATYSIFNGTDLTLGLRDTADYRETAGTEYLDLPTGRTVLVRTTQPGSTIPSPRTAMFSQPTWKIALDQHFGENILGYVSYSRGYKAGVFNTVSLNTAVVRPETVDAVEMGLKSEYFDHRLRVNLAAYYEKYQNIQFSAFANGFYTLENAAGAEVDGLDFEITAAPIRRFNVTLSGTIMDPRYTSFPGGPGYVPVPVTAVNPNGGMGGFLLQPVDLAGKQMIQASKATVNLSANYDIPFASGDLQFSGVVQYRSKYYFDPQNGTVQPAFTQINGSVQWNAPTDKWYVRCWVSNLTDQHIYANITRSTGGDWATPAAPRMFGVAVGVHL